MTGKSSIARRRLLRFGLPLLFLFGLTAFLLVRNSSKRIKVGNLADGSPVYLEGVTYGTTHVMRRFSSMRFGLNHVLPRRLVLDEVPYYESTNGPLLMVWLSQKGGSNIAPGVLVQRAHLRLSFADKDGFISYTTSPSATSAGQPNQNSEKGMVFGYPILQYPRSARTLDLKVEAFALAGPPNAPAHPVGKVTFRNPAKSTTSPTKPQQLPATHTSSGAELELTEAVYWREGRHWVSRVSVTNSKKQKFHAPFELLGSTGNKLHSWPGNRWFIGINTLNDQWQNATWTYVMLGTLSPKDSPWKIRVPFSAQEKGPIEDAVEFVIEPKRIEPPPGTPAFRLIPMEEGPE